MLLFLVLDFLLYPVPLLSSVPVVLLLGYESSAFFAMNPLVPRFTMLLGKFHFRLSVIGISDRMTV